MKYIDEILDSSNNELQFAEKLKEIKEDMTSGNTYKNVNLFVKNLNEYCTKEIEQSKAVNSDYILLNTNHFCMHILQRLVNMMNIDADLHKEAMKKMLRVEKLEGCTEKELREVYVERIFMCLTDSFTDETGYLFEKMKDPGTQFFEVFNVILRSFNLDIIFELVRTKPIIFIGIEGKESAILPGANIYLYMVKDLIKFNEQGELDIVSLYSKLVNNITETAVRTLFDILLNKYEKDMLCNEYNLEEHNLEMAIGKDIAEYVMHRTESKLLSTVRMLVKNIYLPEEQVLRKIDSMQNNAKNKLKIQDIFSEFGFNL